MATREKISFCQVDAHLDTNPKIRRAGRDGREIFLFLLRRVAVGNTSGTVPLKYLEPWYLADQLMMSEDEARNGTSRAVTSNLIVLDETAGVVRVVGWADEWGRRPMTGAERMEKLRSKRPETHNDVTDSDAVSSPTVTVTPSDGCDALDQIRSEEIRSEESKGSLVPSPPAQVKPERPKRSTFQLPVTWAPRNEERASATRAGLDCDSEAGGFRDHHTAKATKFADWDAAFRTWLRNAVKFSRPQRAGDGLQYAIDVANGVRP